MARGHFYPLPPPFIGGRQPYAPALGQPQSAPVASAPPPQSRTDIQTIVRAHQDQRWTLIYTASIAPILATPPVIDAPPVRSMATLLSIVRQWQPVPHRPPALKGVGQFTTAVVPDNPPRMSYVNRSTVVRAWQPPFFHVRGLVKLGALIPPPPPPPSWTGVTFVNGIAVDALGVMGTDWLGDGTPVPAGAVFDGGFARSAAGLRYVCAWPSSGAVVYEGKIARRHDGAMCVASAGTPVEFKAGWALTDRGEVLATTSAPQVVIGGIGMLQTGFVSMSEIT